MRRKAQDNVYTLATRGEMLAMSSYDWGSIHKTVNLCCRDNKAQMYHNILTTAASITKAQCAYLYLVDQVTSVSVRVVKSELSLVS